jgi:hypothetical protein
VIELAPEAVLTMQNTIIAFNVSGAAIRCLARREAPVIACSDIYGNPGGDWIGCIADLAGVDGNFSADPLFCGDLNDEEPLSLAANSPCTPENNPSCDLIGALPVGCSVTSAGGFDGRAPLVSALEVSPNPFNPRTSISFTLERTEEVLIGIYDLTGKLVAKLAHGIFTAGDHMLSWHGSDSTGAAAPSGTYLVRLESTAGVQVRKLSLLR